MKIQKQSRDESRETRAEQLLPSTLDPRLSTLAQLGPRPSSGFTMVEIAICLAIIGFALVAIIGVLPIGMNTQRDNREETIINQDATMFLEAIRNGAQGLDDLTNYVYAITNYWTEYDNNGLVFKGGGLICNGYTYSAYSLDPTYPLWTKDFPINSGSNIVGLLSMPEYTDLSGNPTNNLFSGGYSNHVVAYVRSMSGPAVEKTPQTNDIVLGDSFGYRILCVNAPVVVDTNSPAYLYNRQLAANQHELRLTFLWPQLPNGNVGSGRQTFRTQVAGQVVQPFTNGPWLYFYQPQSFYRAQ